LATPSKIRVAGVAGTGVVGRLLVGRLVVGMAMGAAVEGADGKILGTIEAVIGGAEDEEDDGKMLGTIEAVIGDGTGAADVAGALVGATVDITGARVVPGTSGAKDGNPLGALEGEG
jgi:hypothetical protein